VNYMSGVGYMVGKSFTLPAQVATPASAPTVTQSATGGSLPANPYYAQYTWVTALGETLPSPAASVTTTGSTSTVTVTIPALPAGVLSANIYMSTTVGTETKQGNTATTSFTLSSALVAGSALPLSNTSSIQDITPSALGLTAGSEFIIHNIYYDTQLQMSTYDGAIQVNFDSDTGAGAREGVCHHCSAGQYIRVSNTNTSSVLHLSFDGMQTA
jgi:hypothetical protein